MDFSRTYLSRQNSYYSFKPQFNHSITINNHLNLSQQYSNLSPTTITLQFRSTTIFQSFLLFTRLTQLNILYLVYLLWVYQQPRIERIQFLSFLKVLSSHIIVLQCFVSKCPAKVCMTVLRLQSYHLIIIFQCFGKLISQQIALSPFMNITWLVISQLNCLSQVGH